MRNISPPTSNLLFLPTSIPNTLAPTTVLNAVTGAASIINNFLNPLVASIPQVPQYFFSIPFANNQAVLYKLSIVSVWSSWTVHRYQDFIFPLNS